LWISAPRDPKREPLVGLAADPVDLALDDLGLADGQLEALAAHVLEEHAEVQEAAARDMELVGGVAGRDAERDIGLELAVEAFGDLPAGDELAFLAAERAVVDAEDHVERRLVDLHARHRQRVVGVADGVADVDLAEALDGAQIACSDLVGFAAREALEAVHLQDARLADAAVGAADRDLRAALEDAAVDAADADASDIVAPREVRDQHLERTVLVGVRRRNTLDDFLEELIDALVAGVDVARGPAVAARRVDDREVERVVVGAEVDEQVEHLVHDALDARLRLVALVDDDDRLQAELKRLREHEPRLRHRTLERIDEQQAAVGHAEHALNLAAEVGVTRGVEDVDAVDLAAVLAFADGVGHRAVLREDRDAALALERVRVHHAGLARGPEFDDAGLGQHGVDKRGLAMVDVGDDCDVAELLVGHWIVVPRNEERSQV